MSIRVNNKGGSRTFTVVKILMLGWELPPHNSGGLGVACLQLCQALASYGADIEFVLPYSSSAGDYPFMRVSSALPHQNPSDIFRAYESSGFPMLANAHHNEDHIERYSEGLGRIIELSEFDVIHAHDWMTFRAALRAKEASGRPLIAHVHSIERDRAGGNYGNPLVREIEATGILLADRVVAVSERTRQMISQEYHVPLDKIDVVHNSIDQSAYEPLRDENAYRYLAVMRQMGWKVVVNVGRLTIQKGLSNMITAAAKVSRLAPKTLFLFVGSGEQRDELIMQAASLGIGDKVLFAGFQRGKRWRDAYGVADLFVLPSVSEPFGLTPLEAIGYGTPVLISRQSGVSEILHNCLKVDFWDTDQMANKIHAVVSSPALAKTLHQNSYQEYIALNWNHSVEKLLKIYEQHLQGATA